MPPLVAKKVAREKGGTSARSDVRTGGPSLLGSAGPVFLALAGCAFCFLGGWRGTDWAAQVYRAGQVSHWGFTIWDPGWYGGTYPLNYSVVYPLAAAYAGLWLVAAVSAAGSAFCFDRLVVRGFGRRPAASWYFAASTVVEVAIGQLPTLAAEALALGSVLCLASYRSPDDRKDGPSPAVAVLELTGGFVLGALAGLTSPVVGAFLAMALLAWALADLGRAPAPAVLLELVAAAGVFVAAAAGPLLFPGPGYFPFGFGDLLVVLVICALLAGPLLQAARPVRAGAVIYGVVSIGLFAFRTQMGDNDARLAAYIGVPLVICYLPRLVARLAGPSSPGQNGLGQNGLGQNGLGPEGWGLPLDLGRPRVTMAGLAALATALFLVVWHWAPIVEAFDGAANGPSSHAAFYKPLINQLDTLAHGTPVRVEVPPTVHHWESAFVAPGFSLARGWERQLDMAYNGLFYHRGPLRPSAYRDWLLSNGVSYVALPDAPLDYAATAEATLLRSGEVKGLTPVWRSPTWQLWRVAGSPGLASGPVMVSSITPRSAVVRVTGPGRSLLRVRWSPYWSLGPSVGNEACIDRGPGGWTELRAAHPGQLDLSLSLIGANHGHCPPASSVRS